MLIVISVAAIALCGQHLYWRKKHKESQEKIDDYADDIAKARLQVSEWKHCAEKGQYGLKAQCIFQLDGKALIQVIGVDNVNPKKYFIIKTYEADPADEDDFEFKKREAAELIDIINEKV